MPVLQTDTDVLIVGAGPTGLAIAAELSRQKIDPLIIDRQTAGTNTSRACVVHARTLEVLEPLGRIFRVRERDRVLITIDFSEIPSAYPFTLMCPQNRVEGCLLGHLEELGGGVIRPFEFLRCEALDSHVEAQVRIEGVTNTVKAQWLIGCDGVRSAVREQSGSRLPARRTNRNSSSPTFILIGRWIARKSLYSTRPRGLS
jgi:2-polyprenyl-6-methoxyphenol hydroxylase-like FAD-dependent oxidoreductase